jgi:hypothetical protein
MLAGKYVSAAAALGLRKGYLFVKSEAAWDYLENRQGLVTKNANRQLPARINFYQQSSPYSRRVSNRRSSSSSLRYKHRQWIPVAAP